MAATATATATAGAAVVAEVQRWCRHAPVLEAALAADMARSIRSDDVAGLRRCQEALRHLHGHGPLAG